MMLPDLIISEIVQDFYTCYLNKLQSQTKNKTKENNKA